MCAGSDAHIRHLHEDADLQARHQLVISTRLVYAGNGGSQVTKERRLFDEP